MNIDRIFIINLEYRKDRKKFQEKQIKKYNLQNDKILDTTQI